MKEDVKIFLSYGEYGRLLNKLVDILEPHKGQFKYIYGVPRGGAAIALHLSHHLNLSFIDVDIRSAIQFIDKRELLIVDDIADTGETLINLVGYEGHVRVATMYWKPHSDFKPDFFVRETSDWIVFPWERVDEVPNRERYAHL